MHSRRIPPGHLILPVFIVFLLILSASRTLFGEVSGKTLESSSEALTAKQEANQKELLEASQQFQDYLEKNAAFTEDQELEAYLNELSHRFLEKLNLKGGENFKIKMVRDPTVNAFALGTGHIYFHSGLLARVHNESQLVFVLAHEISHVFHYDSLYQYMDAKKKKMQFKVLDLILAGPSAFVHANGLSDLTLNLIFGAAIQGYGRAQEAQADIFAMEQVTSLGYDPAECLKFFDVLLSEEEKYEKGIEIYFLSSHPSNKRRKADALNWLKTHEAELPKDPKKTPDHDFMRKTLSARLENVKLNMDFQRYFHALQILDELTAAYPEHPQIDYYYGEIYRVLPEKREKIKAELSRKEQKKVLAADFDKQSQEWVEKSRNFYQIALFKDPQFALAYKGLGEWYFATKKFSDAKRNFEEYLKLEPQARDKRSVRRYLRDLDEILAQAPAQAANPIQPQGNPT